MEDLEPCTECLNGGGESEVATKPAEGSAIGGVPLQSKQRGQSLVENSGLTAHSSGSGKHKGRE